MIALASPPPMQSVARPLPAFLFFIACKSVVRILAPLPPIG